TPGGEESAEERGGPRLADPAIDLGAMVAGGLAEETHARFHRAALRVGGAVIEPADAREGNRRRAHGAGLERDIEVAAFEPLRAERAGGLAQRQELRMRGRIAVGERPVAGAGEDRTVPHD